MQPSQPTPQEAPLSQAPTQALSGAAQPKILVSAFACNPNIGSEYGTGWNMVRQIARFGEVWVITSSAGRADIEAEIAARPLPNVHWHYYDLPTWTRHLHRGRERVHYNIWQMGVYGLMRQLHRQHTFDVTQHVTFAQYWTPSFLALLDADFVWGPVGGGEAAPPQFSETFDDYGKRFERTRTFAQNVFEWHPIVRLDARRSVLALGTTPETGDRLRALGAKNVEYMLSAGLDQDDYEQLSTIPVRAAKPFRVLSVGRLLHWKGFQLGVRAFAEYHAKHPESEYWFIGEGPFEDALRTLAADLGISDAITFFGRIPRTEVLERFAEADVLLHPSLHDSAGWVTLEAMAAGRPVVCLDLGGPAMQVTAETGFKVPPRSVQQTVSDIAAALTQLDEDVALRQQMAAAGRARITEHFLWDRIGDQLQRLGIYKSRATTR